MNRPGFSGGLQESRGGSYTSTDNPYSEAHFKTLKYRPEFSERFENIEHARSFCRSFFHWYNHSNRHSGIGLMTPAAVHQRSGEDASRRARSRPCRRLRRNA
ncbi:MAG: integrase core domain-containing protein [Solirubrobacteraceae bacterium]